MNAALTAAQVESMTDAVDAHPLPAGVLTPLQALVILLNECEKSLDFRPSLRKAMAEAHMSIVSAPLGNVKAAPDEMLHLDLEPAPEAFGNLSFSEWSLIYAGSPHVREVSHD